MEQICLAVKSIITLRNREIFLFDFFLNIHLCKNMFNKNAHVLYAETFVSLLFKQNYIKDVHYFAVA